ncbi:hypothetical protein BFS15_04370 [Gardnerella sp. DNF01162]|nr:hypothetical protein BFS15_04370 [Gardnerella sp. DNF01162]RFD73363.1 hypothetical protein AXE72_04990 [Gardnerella vaginalis]RIY27215.1 hypothetical protein CJI51_02350 [Bifidobacteriaceae bacterium WP021]
MNKQSIRCDNATTAWDNARVAATTCLSAAQRARKQLGAPSLLRVESTVCFQRKRGLPSSRLTKAGQICVVML